MAYLLWEFKWFVSCLIIQVKRHNKGIPCINGSNIQDLHGSHTEDPCIHGCRTVSDICRDLPVFLPPHAYLPTLKSYREKKHFASWLPAASTFGKTEGEQQLLTMLHFNLLWVFLRDPTAKALAKTRWGGSKWELFLTLFEFLQVVQL